MIATFVADFAQSMWTNNSAHFSNKWLHPSDEALASGFARSGLSDLSTLERYCCSFRSVNLHILLLLLFYRRCTLDAKFAACFILRYSAFHSWIIIYYYAIQTYIYSRDNILCIMALFSSYWIFVGSKVSIYLHVVTQAINISDLI